MTTLSIIESCASTNSAMPADAPHGFCLMAREQTAGRGQRGNSWEAAPGLNLTMSLMLRPEDIPAASQFRISQAVSLAVLTVVERLGAAQVAVKWPNDVYIADRKLCGILIENSLSGSAISRSVVGIGLNVNQRAFTSPAPNPVSLIHVLGHHTPVEPLAQEIAGETMRLLDMPAPQLHALYRSRLWRGRGEWPWQPADGSPAFTAAITDVLPSGHIVIGGRTFAFKEVRPADIPVPN